MNNMGSKRKKGKSNDASKEQETSENAIDPAMDKQEDPTSKMPETPIDATTTQQREVLSGSSPVPSRSSWSMFSKATPITQIARESISVAQGSTSESSESKRPPNSVSKSIRGSRKSIPLAAEATKVHATSDVIRPNYPSGEKLKGGEAKKEPETKEVVVEHAQLPPDPVLDDIKKAGSTGRQSWFGWWSRPDGYASDSDGRQIKKQKLDNAAEVASSTPLPGTPAAEVQDVGLKNAAEFEGVGVGMRPTGVELVQSEASANHRSSRSWFGLWSSAQNEQAVAEQQKSEDPPSQEQPDITVSTNPPDVEVAMRTSDPPKSDTKLEATERPKASAWAFWSADKPKEPAPTPGGTQKLVGELAVSDTPSQSKPEEAQFNEQREEQKRTAEAEKRRANSLLRPKRDRREQLKESSAESSSAAPTPAEPSPAASQVPTPSQTPPPSREGSQPPKKGKAVQHRPNLILPLFRETYPRAINPGYVERLSQVFARSLHLPGYETEAPSQHISISSSPPKIRKAVAVGVHGFFPGALMQRVLGQPTGTSIRFANYAAKSIKNWCVEHQPEIKDVEVEKVALEGEGYIADRVSTLFKLLLNWTSHLRAADFILVACHSQGVPVAIEIVSKLVQLGVLSSNLRIGICAMAGINLGPFLEYKSRFFGGTALELFEFSDCNSQVSKRYKESLDVCLRHGVRITFAGSIDDQLVSLESSLHTPLTHSYVSRAVFIDGRLHAPNFLTHLVVFALKLRNLGVSDHGLIRELSAPLAGSLVGGEGHSRIYDDEAVYRQAIEFALESTEVQAPSATTLAPTITPYEPPPSSATSNPFTLPWAVRGMLEEDVVKKEFKEELDVLIKEFEDWKPTSKVLRDVRWRLEGVRSMQ